MLRLKVPSINSLKYYEGLFGGVRKKEYLPLVDEMLLNVTKARAEYIELAKSSNFFAASKANYKGRQLIYNALLWLYGTHMKGYIFPSINRTLSSYIKEMIEVCAYCAVGETDQLDHYLPKSIFPELAVVPENLIPCCPKCNSKKSDFTTDLWALQVIHPYYDDFSRQKWLAARLNKGDLVVEYYVSMEESPRRSRLEQHLKLFDLKRRYSVYASKYLIDAKPQFETIFRYCGPEVLQKHLVAEVSREEKRHYNGWRAALLREIASSKWFVEEGCRLIDEPTSYEEQE